MINDSQNVGIVIILNKEMSSGEHLDYIRRRRVRN